MTEVTTAGDLIVTAVVVILITRILLVIATKVISLCRSRDSSDDGADAVPTSSSSSSSSSPGCWKYDVFLSFRGDDTRKTFVDHLFAAFQRHGILTYKDDVTLDRGDTIGPSLMKAIEASQIFVIIFSENYADSSWCLDELTHIMKCRDSETGQTVFPIFYHVDPSDVRKQKGKFGKAFAKHNNNNKVKIWKKALSDAADIPELEPKNIANGEKAQIVFPTFYHMDPSDVGKQKGQSGKAFSKHELSKVQTRKTALVDASNIAGWEPKNVANGHEAKCIEEIVDSIFVKLSSLNSVISDENLVGMGNRLKDLKSQLKIGSGGVRMVGIWGLGGGGKTTLATSLYLEMKISGQFHGCCFVENIREESKQHNGLKSLQEKILSTVFNKKMQVESVELGKHTIKRMLCRRNVLIVLDDVDHVDQLKALAGWHDWFGDGSRIIITTRNEQVLVSHRVDEVYPVSLLSRDEAIRLFNKHAYNEDNPLQDYEMLSQRIVSYADGLPLALIVLGCFLYDKDNDEWIGTLSRLKDHPEMDIVEKLKISYDGLKPVEKELFLDIACFFRGELTKAPMEILDACGFHPGIGIKVLIQKALISVSKDGMFDMHDLVQEMAHYIVRGEHPNNPEKHSRLWRIEDIEDMCSRNSAMENDRVKAIICNVDGSSEFIMLVSNMKKLRLLNVTIWFESIFEEGPSLLSNELRYIEWGRYPATPFPESFKPTKLVVLKMWDSLQKELWNGYKYLPRLKELHLSRMKALVRTPDFGGLPCLQRLILRDSESLEEIHESLGNHKSLVYLSLSHCQKLRRFPGIVGMEKLEILRISRCNALAEFPKIEAKMDKLVELYLDRAGIEVLPSSVLEYCTNLISLKLKGCSNLESIEGNLDALTCLENFHFNFNYNKLGSGIGKGFLSQLPRMLRKLNLSWCGLEDGELPYEIGELSNLQKLNLSGNKFTRLDFGLFRLTRLKLLQLDDCHNLVELPELPSSLAILHAAKCKSLKGIIRDDVHRSCKWLCQVYITGGLREKKNIIGGEKLLETMLQGNAVESGCMFLQLQGGLEIARGFEPRMVEGGRCGMQLPDNWFNDFSGFLFCATSDDSFNRRITMKHDKLEEEEEDSQHDGEEEKEEEEDSQHDGEEESDDDDGKYTWVEYISFELLRNTLWWDQTSTSIQIECDSYMIGCGLKLVPKIGGAERSGSSSHQMETTTHSSSSSEISHDDYNCKLHIAHDSKSALECSIHFFHDSDY